MISNSSSLYAASWQVLLAFLLVATTTTSNSSVHCLLPPIVPRRTVLSSAVAAPALFSSSAHPMQQQQEQSPDGDKGSSPTDTTIHWGIIGLGDVTAVKSGPAFYKCHGSTLVAVMRRTPGAAQRWVNLQPDSIQPSITAYDNLDDMLDHPGLDAVYVATPPGSHREVALRVAEKGLPCYVEKPVGRCAEETEDIVNAFTEKKVPLFTAYVSRSYERTQCVRRLLADGAVGDRVTSITYRLIGTGGARGMDEGDELPWRLTPLISGGGLIMDVGCHVIDRIDYLCGPLIKVAGSAENRCSSHQPVEDYVELTATIGEDRGDAGTIPSAGAQVDCIWDFGNPTKQDPMDELIIVGPKGSLRMAAMSPSLPVEVLDMEGNVVETHAFDAPRHAAQGLIQQVTNELRGVGTAPSRGDNALRTSKVLDEVLSSYYGGTREMGFWERSAKPATTSSTGKAKA